jgi:hypothetical protein
MNTKIRKAEFIFKLVYNVTGKTNKQLATDMNISERHFYRLLKNYEFDISKELLQFKNTLRLKAYNVLGYHLEQKTLKAAEIVLKLLKEFEEFENPNEMEAVDFEFKVITEENFHKYVKKD